MIHISPLQSPRCMLTSKLMDCRSTWWRHQMETFSALLAICAGNSPVSGEFPAHRPVTRSFDVFFDLRPKKRLSKQWWGWWSATLLHPLWHHCNELFMWPRGVVMHLFPECLSCFAYVLLMTSQSIAQCIKAIVAREREKWQITR